MKGFYNAAVIRVYFNPMPFIVRALCSVMDLISVLQDSINDALYVTCNEYECVNNRVCGVQSFYIPRSNPDGYGVTIYCIDPGTVKSVEVKTFDGAHWEESFASSKISMLSKT